MRSTTLRLASLSFSLAAFGNAGAQIVKPPAPGPLRPYVFPNVQQFALDNGLKVILVEKHTLPVVEGRLILDAGAMREPAAKNGLASLTGRLLSEGTADMTGAEIARQMDALGAQYGTGGIQQFIRRRRRAQERVPAGDGACGEDGHRAEPSGD